MKFRMRLSRNWVSITDHMCVTGRSLVLATPIGYHYACQILIYGLIMLKFGIPSLSNQQWVW